MSCWIEVRGEEQRGARLLFDAIPFKGWMERKRKEVVVAEVEEQRRKDREQLAGWTWLVTLEVRRTSESSPSVARHSRSLQAVFTCQARRTRKNDVSPACPNPN